MFDRPALYPHDLGTTIPRPEAMLKTIPPQSLAEEHHPMNAPPFSLRLPPDLKAAASEQAQALGISLNQYVATTLAARVGAQPEAARFFRQRGARGDPARALALLDTLGDPEAVADDDRLDAPPTDGNNDGTGAT
jgi:hypothetical protein